MEQASGILCRNGTAGGRGFESAEQDVPMPHSTWIYVRAARIARTLANILQTVMDRTVLSSFADWESHSHV